MSEPNLEQALTAAKLESRTLGDQLRQARADLHRLGVSDQNRVLVYSAIAGGLGCLGGVGIGLKLRGK